MKTVLSTIGVFRRHVGLAGCVGLAIALAQPAGAQVALSFGPDVRPAQSIEHAFELLKVERAAGNKSPAEITLRSRVHAIDETIVIDPSVAGRGLVITAIGGAATISGGQEVRGWQEEGDVWTTTINDVAQGEWWFEGLYVDGERRTIARYPNEGWLRVDEAGPDKRTSFTCMPGDLPEGLNPDGLRIVFLHDWSSSIIDVSEVDRENNTLRFADPIGPNAPHYRIDNFEKHPRYRLEGTRELIDEPGEWSLDRQTGVLTYMPMPGETIGTTRVIAPRLETLVRIEGTEDSPVRTVSFKNIRFAHTNWNIPKHGYAEGQAAFFERRSESATDGTRIALPAAISMKWAEGCAITHSVFELLGASGVWIGQGCKGSAITNSLVRDVAGNGVMFGETRTRHVDGKPWWQSAPEQVASHNVVQNCLIERCGQRFAGSVGVWIGIAEYTLVEYNEVRDLPYTGVSLGWMWNPTPTPCKANVIYGNHIHHVMQELSDGGGIYALGYQPGTMLKNNAIHSIRVNAGRAPSNGMFIDEGSTDLVISGNTIWDTDKTPIRFHKAGKNIVRDNVFVLGEGVEIAQYNRTDPADISYANNVTPKASEWTQEQVSEAVLKSGPKR